MRYGRWLVVVLFTLGVPAAGPAPHEPTIPRARTVEEQLSRSTEGLVEIPSPVPNGGTMVRTHGRFKSLMVLTSAPDEPVAARCVDDADSLRELEGERRRAASETD